MRQVCVTRFGAPRVLEVREAPDPIPAGGEVRIAVRFAGLNFSDVVARAGLYPDAPKPPCVTGYEVSGVVDAVGPGVDPSQIGVRVLAPTSFGGHSEYVCAPASRVFATPDRVSDEAAAALIVNYLMAHHVLYRLTDVQPTDTVLIHAAAGGVGTAAVQLARLAGARMLGTASPQKHDHLRASGVEPIDYRQRDWPNRVRELTDGRGADIVLDSMGGSSFRKSYALLAPGGRLFLHGNFAMSNPGARNVGRAMLSLVRMPRFSALQLMNENRGVVGVHLGHLWSETAIMRPQIEHLLELLGQGAITPIIDRVFPFAEAADAHERLESRANIGKVLLTP